MSRGKNAANVNRRLREELQASNEDRRKLESKLADVRRTLDQTLSRLANIEAEGHPLFEAERKRADAAEIRAHASRVDERQRWERLIDDIRPTWVRLVDLAADHDVPVFSESTIEAAADLFGPAALGAGASTRHHRRNLKDSASLRKITGALDEAERQGVTGLPVRSGGSASRRHAEMRERLGLTGHKRNGGAA